MDIEEDLKKLFEKRSWHGRLLGVQPRIRLCRSFDEQTHSYLGYTLLLQGTVDGVQREFSVGIGKVAQKKHAFCAGEEVSGQSYPVPVPKLESVEFYRTSGLKKPSPAAPTSAHQGPPWLRVCPDLQIYRSRGHRRLDKRTYAQQCQSCMWGCRMAVEIIVDHWTPDVRRYRYETFCYGPKSCALHRSGPKRKVPGRKGMTYIEEDWVEEELLSHRGPDD